MRIFELPDLGEGLHDAEIVAWHVTKGDHVVTDQPLLSVETDKAIVELPSPQSARIARLFGDPGDRVEVGQPLVEFEALDVAVDPGTVVGDIDATVPTPTPFRTGRPVGKATPAVRALARTLGIDLATVQGTGPEGAVTRSDVQRVAAALAVAPSPEPMRGVRRAMAERMRQAHAEVAAATVMDEATISEWLGQASIMLRLIHAVVAGCRASPSVNAWFEPIQMTRRLHTRVDVGIAVDTVDGLFVPVLRDVAHRTPDDLERALAHLTSDVAERRIPASDLRGQTITLSNFGAVGGRFAELVVVPPQVAILGVGRIRQRVVAVDGQPVVRRVVPLSMTFDHRAVTGVEAAGFLRAAVGDLERPRLPSSTPKESAT